MTNRLPNSREFTSVDLNCNDSKKWEHWVLLQSDAHLDSNSCDVALMKKHLDLALERKASILCMGDLFDVMQTKHDKRQCKSEMSGDMVGEGKEPYLDGLVSRAVKFYTPYAKNIVVMSEGNHEQYISAHCETNLTKRLVRELNAATGSSINACGMRGFVKFLVHMYRARGTVGLVLFFTHGSGVNPEVTKGVLRFVRRAAYTPDADVVVGGHIHTEAITPISRFRLTERGNTYEDRQWHIQLGSYKKTRISDSFEALRDMAPTMPGAAWLRLTATTQKGSENKCLVVEPMPAV